MSERHAKRIRQVGREIDAALEVLERSADYAANNRNFYAAELEDLQRALANAEQTYFFRLVAELEGMLYQHLRDHVASFVFEEDDSARKLLSHTRTRLGIPAREKAYASLAFEVEEVIEWRNSVVHGGRGAKPARVPLKEAENRVHDLVRLLPEMKEIR